MSGWISVNDRLPGTGEKVLVYVPDDEPWKIHTDIRIKSKKEPWQEFLARAVTHWQPLPPPPGAEDDVRAAINKAECV